MEDSTVLNLLTEARELKLVLESLMHWFREGRHPVLQLETLYAYEPAQWAIVLAALTT